MNKNPTNIAFLFSCVLTGSLVIFLLLLPFWVDAGLISPTKGGHLLGFYYGIGVLGTLWALYLLFATPNIIGFTYIDLCFLLWLGITLFGIPGDDVGLLFQYAGVGLLYGIVRTLPRQAGFLTILAIVLAGAGQAMYAQLQLYGFFESYHNGFNMTGSFFNPGPLAGFLAITGVLAFGLWMYSKEFTYNAQWQVKSIPVIAMLAVLSIMLVLPALQSRASWLAVVGGSLWLAWDKLPLKVYIDRYLQTPLKKGLLAGCLIAMVLGSGWGLYQLKKDSADGRLLIWKVGTHLALEKPWFGHGTGGFARHYMEQQANYFAGQVTIDQQEASVAGSVRYAFNEYLKAWVEGGIINFLVLIGLMIAVLLMRPIPAASKDHKVLQAGLIALGIFGAFAYPSAIVPIVVVGTILLALCGTASQRLVKISDSKQLKIGFSLVSILLFTALPGYGIWTYNQQKAWYAWEDAYETYNRGLYETACHEYKALWPMLQSDSHYLTNYGKALFMAGKHQKAIEILEQSKQKAPTTLTYTTLGDSYKALEKYKEAEKAYWQAFYMVPSRFYPKYLLAKIYKEQGDQQAAIAIAQEILNKKVKVPSEAIDEIKDEMRKIMNQKPSSS